MMRWTISILLLLMLGACAESASNADAQEPAAAAQNADGSVVLRVYINRDELSTVEQLRVVTELSRKAGSNAQLESTDWDAAGWTLVAQTHKPETLDSGFLVSTQTTVVEPFLDGAYSIPSVVASAGDWKIATDPISITVSSVLDEADPGEIIVTTELLPPSEPRERSWTPIVLIGVGVGLMFAGAVFFVTNRPEHTEPTAREQLEMIANGKIESEHEALAIVHRVINTLSADDRFRDVLDACDRARYTGSLVQHGTAQTLADQTLSRLEGA